MQNNSFSLENLKGGLLKSEEKHKHQCLIRQLIKWRKEWGLKKFREYLAKSKLDR